jgi:uncharacterized protein with HEPN domain
MSPRDKTQRLQDVIERIERIGFSESMLVKAEEVENCDVAKTAFDSILYDLVVIGEAVKTFRNDFKKRHPEIPWADIAGMRDILTHEYFRVNSALLNSISRVSIRMKQGACMTFAPGGITRAVKS